MPTTRTTKRATPTKKRPAVKQLKGMDKVSHHAKHIFVPHKGNQYRPHLIRWRGLAIVLAIALVWQIGYTWVSTGKLQVLGFASNISVTELVKDTNDERLKEGLGELKLNESLNKAAYAKAQNMFAENYWAHVSPSGTTPWEWLADQQYDYDSAGENLAKNYPTAAATVSAWMASPTHKANILKPEYTEVGFAVVDGTLEGKSTTLVVAYYGDPAETIAANPITLAAPVNTQGAPLAQFGSIIQSISPGALGTLGLLALVAIVGGVAHHYRKKLPIAWRKSWKLHHGLYTVTGVVILMVIVILGTGGGQI